MMTFKVKDMIIMWYDKLSIFQKIIDFIKAPRICRHGIVETQEYCPLCFGYRNGAVKPTSSMPPLGKGLHPAPQKK